MSARGVVRMGVVVVEVGRKEEGKKKEGDCEEEGKERETDVCKALPEGIKRNINTIVC